MPTVWENSYVTKLQTLFGKKHQIDKSVQDIRKAIAPLIGPDSAKILVAIATDVMNGVQKRNDRPDVNAACAVLQAAVQTLEAVSPNLDG